MSTRPCGRHRAPGRVTPVSELSAVVRRSAKPAVQVTTGLAVTGGLALGLAAPASAASLRSTSASTARTAGAARPAGWKAASAASTSSSVKRAAISGSVLSIARSLSGIMYVWGGTTPSGFDCSGFTRYIYRKVGKTLPRTAAAQQRATKRVTSPRPGDLVFFGYPAHHVGIYAGNGKMYDSPRTGRATGLHTIWSSTVTYGRVL